MYELRNFSEIIVKKMLEEYLAHNDIPCKCERCLADIMACALNRLPPRYYVSLKGEVLTHFEAQTVPDKTRVLAEVVVASQIVAAAPSHPRNTNP
jgi:competence protein ComFB